MPTIRSCLRFNRDRLCLATPWAGSAAGTIVVNDEPVTAPWSRDASGQPGCRHGPWQLTLQRQGRGLALEIANTGTEPCRLRTVHFGRWTPGAFAPRLLSLDFRELIHGGSFRAINSGVKVVGRRAPGLEFIAPSGMFTVYQADDGAALLLGVLPPVGQAFAEFATLHAEPHYEGAFGVEARHVFDAVVLPGRALHTSPLVALTGADGTALMAEYGRLWRRQLERKPTRPPVVGWNSWDFYSGAVTRQAMDENVAAAADRFGGALKVFAIDEGWEAQWGAWEPNVKFPEGLADFCRHVKAAGCVPGVWTAPLLVNTYNPLFLAHPDWFAGRADGQLQTDTYAYGPMAYLDVTRPEVIEHLSGVFRRLRAAGFEYFKIDFSHCILNATRFHDPTVPRAELIRRAFAAIRAAIGEDAYLLSCGSPYESVAGLVDAVRTTGDIHIYWGHVLTNAGALAAKWWMQGNVWNGDPDFLVVRGPDTATPPYFRRRVVAPLGPDGGWMAGPEFTEMEARTYALLVHLSGGDVVLGDPLRQLNPTGLAMLRRVLEPRPPAVPVDLFTSEQNLPQVWISRGREDTVVGLFNWLDKPSRLEFDPEQHGLKGSPRDFWTGERAKTLPARMPRRSSLALRFG